TGDVDLVCGFATDWEIAFYDLVVLDDDRHYFPNYHGAPLVRADFLRKHPEARDVLNRLHNRIDDDTMRRLNYQVARERRPEAGVAREFLLKQGLGGYAWASGAVRPRRLHAQPAAPRASDAGDTS